MLRLITSRCHCCSGTFSSESDFLILIRNPHVDFINEASYIDNCTRVYVKFTTNG